MVPCGSALLRSTPQCIIQVTYFIVLYHDFPARISTLRALTSALSSAMSCDSRLGSSIAFSLCRGCFRRRGWNDLLNLIAPAEMPVT